MIVCVPESYPRMEQCSIEDPLEYEEDLARDYQELVPPNVQYNPRNTLIT